jgi:hypothetical protein
MYICVYKSLVSHLVDPPFISHLCFEDFLLRWTIDMRSTAWFNPGTQHSAELSTNRMTWRFLIPRFQILRRARCVPVRPTA